MTKEIQQKKIKGRVVALWETGITFVFLILGLFGVGDLREGWKDMGTIYSTIFLGSLTLFWAKQTATTIGGAMAKAKEMVAKYQNGGNHVEEH